MRLTKDELSEIEVRIEKYQNTPQSVGDTNYLPDKIAGSDAPALLAEVKHLRAELDEEKKELLEILERVGKWYKANGVRYVIAEDVWNTLYKYTGEMLDCW